MHTHKRYSKNVIKNRWSFTNHTKHQVNKFSYYLTVKIPLLQVVETINWIWLNSLGRLFGLLMLGMRHNEFIHYDCRVDLTESFGFVWQNIMLRIVILGFIKPSYDIV